MDPRTLIIGVVGPIVTMGFVAALFAILQATAARRGASLLCDLGTRGWIIAILVVGAAGMFSGIVVNVLLTPSNLPPTWIPLLVNGPILATIGIASFVLAWKQVLRGLSRIDPQATQKG